MSILAIFRRRTLAGYSSLPLNFPPARSLCSSQRWLSDQAPTEDALPLRRIESDTIASPFEELDLDGFAESVIETVEEDSDFNDASNIRGGWKPPKFPISPLMDPEFLAARQKHQIPKPIPSKEPTLFQRRLATNPYAIALATPVRLCKITRSPMPNFFLQDVQIAAHPNTGNPTYVPRGVFLEQRKTKLPKKDALVQHSFTDGPRSDLNTLWQDRQLTQNPNKDSERRIGPSIWTLASYRMMGSLNDSKAGFGNKPLGRLLPPRMSQRDHLRKIFFQAHWREDMPEFILELARRRLFEMLCNLDSQKRHVYLSGFDNWTTALGPSSSRKVVFMWTKPVEKGGDVEPPGEFASFKLGGGKVPLHNLQTLLGKDKLQDLREYKGKGKPSIFDNPIIKIKSKNMTLGLQMRLWWLQCYLAEHKNIDPR